MKGHEAIIALRRERKAPPIVWLSLHDDLPNFPTVLIDRADVPELLDLRFLVGLTAIVEGRDDDAMAPRLAAACSGVAHRTICTVGHALLPYGYKTTQITDTQGEMTWPN